MACVPEWPVFDGERFTNRLRETASWCQHRLDGASLPPAQLLRSAELTPGSDWVSSAIRTDMWPRVLDTVALRRSDALRTMGDSINPVLPAAGRLLLFIPGESVWDEVEACETEGFFDGDGSPPWDTWVDCFELPSASSGSVWGHRYVVSWIPRTLTSLAQRGVAVTCVDALRWVTAADAVCRPGLSRSGLSPLLGE
jgi:hypothetical protein